MIVCRRCSRRHPDGTEFCTCGAYLEFDGEPAPDQTTLHTPAPDSPATGAPAADPIVDARKEPQGWSGLPDQPAARRDDATAVLPATAGRGRGALEAHVPSTSRPDDVNCPSCGTSNPRGSSYCRSCARQLVETSQIVTPQAPQRRRWFRWRHERPNLAAARRMTSPAARRVAPQVVVFRVVGAVVGVGVLMAVLGVLDRPSASGLLDRVGLTRYDQIDLTADDVAAVSPGDASAAPAEFAYRTPDRVVDRASNTAWATRWTDPADLGEEIPGDGCQPWRTEQILLFEFGSPTDIDRVQILAGRSADDPARDSGHQPRVIQFALPADSSPDRDDLDRDPADGTTDAAGTCRSVTVADDGVLSAHDLSLDDVTVLEVGVIAVSEGEAGDSSVELSEVVFEHR